MPTEQDVFFESLYQSHFNKLKTIAYSQIENLPVAEELVQETFVVAWENYETLRQREEPFAYLKKTLKYKVLEYRREIDRYRRLFLSMDHELIAQIKAPSNPSPVSIHSILETIQETLTNDEWIILWKFSMEGASHRQIADAMGIEVPTSYKRLERIRKKLKDVLPEYRK